MFEIWAEGLDVRLRPTGDRDLAQLRERLRRFLDEWDIDCASEDVTEIGNAILRAAWGAGGRSGRGGWWLACTATGRRRSDPTRYGRL